MIDQFDKTIIIDFLYIINSDKIISIILKKT